MVMAVVSNYWVLIPAILVMTIFLALRWYFLRTSREIKRLEAIGTSHSVAPLPGLPHLQYLAGYSMQIWRRKAREILVSFPDAKYANMGAWEILTCE